MLTFPNCKINLGLWVTGRRDDGYHDIETVFYPVPLTDILEIIVAPDQQERFTMTGLEVPGDRNDNLCIKAYRMVAADHAMAPVHIHLHKLIPAGAGLGGGSSDGAHTLMLLDRLFDMHLSSEVLHDYAARLGSDCPFFLQDKPAYALERGDKMERFDLDLSGHPLMIVVPSVHISTAEAYGMIEPEERDCILKDLLTCPLPEWKEAVTNDFEGPLTARFPGIGRIRDRLYETGALYASMSGSGSAVYGLFPKESKPEVTFPDAFQWLGTL
jgi:4-diphosphocytidyl-2-C-methyl-D-erythritol kinase